jgi:hypothetical protein
MAFRFNGAGTTAMGKPSAACATETTKGINSLFVGANMGILLPEGLCHFAFRRLSEKQKRKTKNSAIFAALR